MNLTSLEGIADPAALKLLRDLTVEVIEGNEDVKKLEQRIGQLEQKVGKLVHDHSVASKLVVEGDTITEIRCEVNKAITQGLVRLTSYKSCLKNTDQ